MASLLLVVLNSVLVGYLQPYSRYAYRAAVQAVTNASFLTLLRPNVFTSVEGTTAFVEGMSADKSEFDRVFLYTRAENGDEVAIFKGRPGGLLWIDLTLVEGTGLTRDEVPDDRVADITDGVEQGSLADAHRYVTNVEEQAAELAPPTTTTTASTTTTVPVTTAPVAPPPAP